MRSRTPSIVTVKVSGDDSAKTQLSLNDSYNNKETEKQLRSWYDQFISSKYVDVN